MSVNSTCIATTSKLLFSTPLSKFVQYLFPESDFILRIFSPTFTSKECVKFARIQCPFARVVSGSE